MPLQIRGTTYAIPKEGNEPGPTGREIIEIEDHFELDGLKLMEILGSDGPSGIPGYTRAKAYYAMAWICMTRKGEILSIADVLNEYSIDEFEAIVEGDESPKELASAEAVPENE
jgi:hypothetical protein